MAEGYVIFDVAIGDEKYNWKGKYFVGMKITTGSNCNLLKLSYLDGRFYTF